MTAHLTKVPKLTILIKALNEEDRIEECLAAAVSEAIQNDGEIILVDSLSTDNTVALASNFPIKIVQFLHESDRGCGAAVQLGFQHVSSDFVYILDADMVLQPGFIAKAIEILESDSSLAGVGGKLLDRAVRTAADEQRVRSYSRIGGIQFVKELGGGGLYRTSAVKSVGYLAHRWLPAFEEAELGVRLVSNGWRLARVADVSVVHDGHVETTFQMLGRLWRNRRAHAAGMFLRSSLFKPWFFLVLRKQFYLISFAVLQFFLIASFFVSDSIVCGLFFSVALCLMPISFLLFKRRSLKKSIESFLVLNWLALAAVLGFFISPKDPSVFIDGRSVK